MQVSALKKVFEAFNPAASTDEVDWEAHVDSKLTLSENRGILADAYPGFEWYRSSEPRGAFDR